MKRNNIFTYLILLLGISFTACNDLLEVEPQQSVEAGEALTNGEDLESAVIGLYSTVGGPALYGTNLNLIPELLGGEEHLRWRGTFQSYRDIYNKGMVADNADARRTWVNAYEAINQANIILKYLNLATDADQRDRIEGQARFLRGILYFELVRLYGKAWNDGNPDENPGVPLILTATETEQEATKLEKRASVAQVYAQAITDLTAAKDLLPTAKSEFGNSYSASAFLARVYLQQGRYDLARDEADRVIESSLYRLTASVFESFRNDNASEVVFEIQQNIQNNAGTANDGLSTFYASLVGIGRGDVQIITSKFSTYTLYDEEDARFQDLFYVGEGRRAGRIYSGKWIAPEHNIPVIRLAEMYLIRAEANLRLGTAIGATPLQDINRIRQRAGITPLAAVTLDDIILERRLELAYEGHRIHDLKRLEIDLAFDRDPDTGENLDPLPWDDNMLVLPIPKREIDATGGDLKQNPGY